MPELDLGFSSCPNDTFIFHAMLHGCIETGDLKFHPHIHDVEELNNRAFSKSFHVTKLSFFAYLKLKEYYDILDSGSAIGYGCGPLLVGRTSDGILPDMTVAIPGELTTAFLLLKLWMPEIRNITIVRFDRIMEGVRSGKYDAGLIIHEGRFIYHKFGLQKIIDLGEWWENETGLPIPLGCIAIRNDEPFLSMKHDIESAIRRSVLFAFEKKDASREFVKAHAQELDDAVIDSHINLYVNDFTVSLGDKGMKTVAALEDMIKWKKIL